MRYVPGRCSPTGRRHDASTSSTAARSRITCPRARRQPRAAGRALGRRGGGTPSAGGGGGRDEEHGDALHVVLVESVVGHGGVEAPRCGEQLRERRIHAEIEAHQLLGLLLARRSPGPRARVDARERGARGEGHVGLGRE